MTTPFTLTATKGGIDRQRTEGSPSKDVLYDFVNGYRNQSMKAVARPGTLIDWNLRSGGEGSSAGLTKGFIMFRGEPYVFSNQVVAVPDGVNLEVLQHPEIQGLALRRIHFVNPFLQNLYVVAEFINGDVYHYWLITADAWQANNIYMEGDVVQPSSPNGLVFRAERLGEPYPQWAPNTEVEVGDRFEPTTANGYYYEIIQIQAGGEVSSPTTGGGTSGGGIGSGTSVGGGVSYGDTSGMEPYPGYIVASGGYLSGYVGVPYLSSCMYSDESVRPVVQPYKMAEVEWVGTPPAGLSAAALDWFNHGYPSAGGMPTVAGAYNWTVRMSEIVSYGLLGTSVDVPVSVNILATPSFAVIDPSQRSQYNVSMVDDSPKPLMHAKVGRPGPLANIVPATAVTTPGATTEDFYAEVQFIEVFNGSSPFGGVRSAWMGITAAAPLETYRNGAVDIINPSAPPPNTWIYRTNQTGTDGIAITAGDIGMIYGQPSTGKVWFGVNGVWVGGGDPTTGDNPYHTDLALIPETFGGAFRIFAGGYGDKNNVRDEFVINCGNTPFAYTPPNAVTGMAFLSRDVEAQFDVQNRSPLVVLKNLGAEAPVVVASVNDDYSGSDFGSAVCTVGHSTGKRQFEFNALSADGQRIWMGAVRSDFDPTVLTSRAGLANTIGVRPWTPGSTDGEIAVDGVTAACGTGNAIDAVITFALDLDADTYAVYINGVLEASGALPVLTTEWFPAISGQMGAAARMRTLNLRYPVATYLDWAE